MWECQECGCRAIAAGLDVCPQCGEERNMPKITSGGASNAREELEPGTQAVETPAVPAAPAPEAAAPAEAEEPAPPQAEQQAQGQEQAAPTPVPDVASMTKAELQDHADSLGLPTDGTKATLAARITDHVEATAADAEVSPQP